MKLFIAVLVFIGSPAIAKVTYDSINEALRSGSGLVAEVHGADQDSKLYVVAVRNPDNFFDALQVPLVADYTHSDFQKVRQVLGTLSRHDRVLIKGQLRGSSAPEMHIMATSLEVTKKFDGGYENYPPYDHQAKLPGELLNQSTAIFKVHAVIPSAPLMVVEFKDVNVPLVVPSELVGQIENLYRGDKISVDYEILGYPTRPTHLTLKSLRVLDSLVTQHGQPISHCGELVMFPESPQVRFNVFAIKKDIGDDLFRTYTLINFEDMDLFFKLRDKAQASWDGNKNPIQRGRNYYINPKIKACATGVVNMIDPSQANPQITINNLEDLTFEYL